MSHADFLNIFIAVLTIVISVATAFGRIGYHFLDKRLCRLEEKLTSPPIADKLQALRLQIQLRDRDFDAKLDRILELKQ